MTSGQQGVGRPRDAGVDLAIVAATREVLAERGYARLTVDSVAARAGVGKAAIYRRYATKQEMIFSATVDGLRENAPADTGSLRSDLAAVVEAIATQLGRAPAGVLTGLLADIYADPALAARFSATFLVHQRDAMTRALERAILRGELTRRPDPLTVQALLIGPMFAWLLILGGDRDRTSELAGTVAAATAAVLMLENPPSGVSSP